MELFEYRGHWWTLDNPSTRVAGVLRFERKRNGLTLDLLETLGATGAAQDVGSKSHGIILGSLYESPWGQSVTLTDCLLTSSTMNSSGLTSEQYRVGRAFFGRHLAAPEDFLFNRAKLGLSGLSAWAAHLSGIQFKYDEERGETGRGFQLSYTPPRPLEAKVHGGEVNLFLGGGATRELRKQSIVEEIVLAIATAERMRAGDWNDRYIYPLQNLLTLATDTPNAPTKWELSDVEDRSDGVTVVESRVFKGSGEDSAIRPNRMLFPLKGLEERFPSLIERWLEVSQTYRAACNVFFALRYAPGPYTDMLLLGFSQALEHYLSRQPNIQLSATPAVPAGVLAVLAPDKQEELRRWTETLTVDTFRSTLRHLAEQQRTVLEPLAGHHGLEKLIKEIIKYRTYVLHRVDRPESEDYAIGLFLAVETLSCLMKSCFLTELGFTPQERASIFQRNAMYGFLQGKWAELLAMEGT